MLASILSLQQTGCWPWLLWLLCPLIIIELLHSRYGTGLRKYNGPFLASFTNLWRLCHAYRNRHREPMLHLHARYGDVVRLGPRALSFGQPQAIKDIYGPGRDFKKSEYYPVNAATANGRYVYTLFSSIDEIWHGNLRKSINWIFTPSAAASYEPIVDNTLRLFLQEINRRFADRDGPDGVIDFSQWFLYFTFDVMGDLTYSRRYGFLESGRDVDGIISYVQNFLSYGFFLGQAPIIDRLFRHNIIIMWLERHGLKLSSVFPGVPFTNQRLQERQEEYKVGDNSKRLGQGVSDDGGVEDNDEDLLDRFFRAKKDHPDHVTDKEIRSLSLTMMFAGSETTGLTLTAILYYLLRAPSCYLKLQTELETCLPKSHSSTDDNRPIMIHPTLFADAHALPYLTACIQETFRMHPPFGSMYERVVPPHGATICGQFVPGGTVVGCNPWVVHRNRDVFGDDVDIYRPERWLIGDGERLKQMHRTMHQFGGGEHVCLGRHVSYLEIFKVVPTLIGMYEMKLEDPGREWTITNGANVRMSSVRVRMKARWPFK